MKTKIKKLHNIALYGSKKKIKEALNKLCGEKGFDLNKIIPMPAELRQVRDCSVLKYDMRLWERQQVSTLNRKEMYCLQRVFHGSDRSYTHYKNAYYAVRCLDRFGYFSPKKWTIKHWGVGDFNIENCGVKWLNNKTCQISFFAVPEKGLTGLTETLKKMFPRIEFSWSISEEEMTV